MLATTSKSKCAGAFLQSPSEETLVPDPLTWDFKEPSKHDFFIRLKPVFSKCSSLLSLERTTKISIACINCVSRGKGNSERTWQGIILGRRAAGSLQAVLVRMKLRHTDGPLFEFLTLCTGCCTELELNDQASQMNRIVEFKDRCCNSKMMRMRATNDVVEELLSTKVIVFMGMFITPFRTLGSDGEWKEWNKMS